MRRLFSILMLLCAASAFAQYADSSDVIRGVLEDARRNLKEKRYSMAQYYCDKGLEIQADNEDLLHLKADVFYQMSKYEDAVKTCGQVIALQGKLAGKARYMRAMAEYMQASYREAVQDLTLYQKTDTLYSSGLETFFECYLYLRKADSAQLILRQFLKRFPKNKKYYKCQARLFALKHQNDSASRYFYLYDSLIKEPDYHAVRLHAKLLIQMGEYKKAADQVNRILDVSSNSYNGNFLKAELLLSERNFAELQTKLDFLHNNRPDDPDLYLLLARANFYGMDNNDAALQQLEECFKRGGDKNPEAWYLRGAVKIEQKLHADALKDLEEAFRIDPYYTDALSAMSDCFIAQHLYDDALNCYGKALKINPAEADIFDSRGYCYLRLNKIGKAKADFEKAAGLKPLDPTHQEGLAITCIFEKHYDKAVSYIDHAIKLATDQKDTSAYQQALFFKWTTLIMAGKPDSAALCLELIKPSDPAELKIYYYFNLLGSLVNKKYSEVEKTFALMDTAVTYHMPEYVNLNQMICERRNDYKGWVRYIHDFFIRNSSNFYLLDNTITYNEENSKNLLRHEQIDVGDGLLVFKNIDSTLQISVTVASKPDKERARRVLEELDKEIPKVKDPEVLYLIKARFLARNEDKAAIDAFNKAIELKPDYKAAYYFRGLYKKKKLKDEKGGEEDLAKSK